MKNKTIFILIVIIIIISNNCYATKDISELREEDLIISGIVLETPIKNVLKNLGQPIKFKDNGEIIFYYYEKLIIKGFRGETIGVMVNGKGLKTFRGISIGDKKQDVIKQYGKGIENKGYIFYIKYYDSYEKGIYFKIENEKVKLIETYVALD